MTALALLTLAALVGLVCVVRWALDMRRANLRLGDECEALRYERDALRKRLEGRHAPATVIPIRGGR